jgi:formylglycine-generating enzyme required for sulfatase activity
VAQPASSSLPNASFIPPLIKLSGDTFTRGASATDSQARNYEKPAKTVGVKDFSIGKYEVTVAEFEAFVKESNYVTTAEKDSVQYIFTNGVSSSKKGISWRHNEAGELIPEAEKANYPVIRVSWFDAEAYCNWLSSKTGKNSDYPPRPSGNLLPREEKAVRVKIMQAEGPELFGSSIHRRIKCKPLEKNRVALWVFST